MNYNYIRDDYDTDASSSLTTDIKRFDSLLSNDDNSSVYTIVTTPAEKGQCISTTYGSIIAEEDGLVIIKQHQCSTMGASVNLVNAMMGTGIIGLPLALHLCGFWLGLFFAIAVAYICCMTMHITILCGMKTQTHSLVSLTEKILGRAGSRIINLVIFVHTAGTTVSYYMLLGDTLPSLLALVFPNTPFFSDRRCVILAFGLLCTLPLSLSRSTAQFAKWSAMSVALLFMMLIGVMARVPYYISEGLELEVQPLTEDTFKGLAIMTLSFGCAQNVFGVYSSTREPSRWLFTCSMAVIVACLINVVFAVTTYLCFGKNVMANILLNFPKDDSGIRFVKLTLGLFMVLTIPLCVHPCREALMMIFGMDINHATNKQHYTATIATFAVILSVSASITSLGKVFSFIGGFSTTTLSFLLPGCAYIYLHWKEDKKNWILMSISFVSIIIAMPVMYFSVKDVLS